MKKSHKRGHTCRLKKTLHTQLLTAQSATPLISGGLTLPRCYAEAESGAEGGGQCSAAAQAELDALREKQSTEWKTFVPAASRDDNQFSVVKFYAMSSDVIHKILSRSAGGDEEAFDFPHGVDEVENKVIVDERPGSRLLLGRSGTGKTTIIMYRMWRDFQRYWRRALDAADDAGVPPLDAPLFPQGSDWQSKGRRRRSRGGSVGTGLSLSHIPSVGGGDGGDSGSSDAAAAADAAAGGGSSGGSIVSNLEPLKRRRGASTGSVTDVVSGDEEDVQNAEEDEEDEEILVHLHQMFITKSSQLRFEVHRAFKRLRNGGTAGIDGCPEDEFVGEQPPESFNDLPETQLPLFLTSREFLVAIDGTVEGQGFQPFDSNAMAHFGGSGRGTSMAGDDDDEVDILNGIPLVEGGGAGEWGESDSDEWWSDEEEEEEGGELGDGEEQGIAAMEAAAVEAGIKAGKRAKARRKIARNFEVTYDYFSTKLWPKIKNAVPDTTLDPSLVWTEIRRYVSALERALILIWFHSLAFSPVLSALTSLAPYPLLSRSFIKGSVESLFADGCLDRDSYLKFGRKRSDMSNAVRPDVYTLFERYETVKKKKGLWDEADLVTCLHRRVFEHGVGRRSVRFQRIYIDEVQDFTQAELFLVMQFCSDINGLFLAGDTAQNIVRGLAFRFDDIRDLFYREKERREKEARERGWGIPSVEVPGITKLVNNYRSHEGSKLGCGVIGGRK